MPLIVDEVIISVEVTGPTPAGGAAAPSSAEDKHTIINECVERVLEILSEREER